MTTMIMRSVARTGLLVAAFGISMATIGGCKKPGGESGAAPAPAAGGGGGGGPYKFAFVTNNSAGFWNIALKGIQKAEKDFGIKAELLRPLKGELAEEKRFIED